jgi:hypothetical protein
MSRNSSSSGRGTSISVEQGGERLETNNIVIISLHYEAPLPDALPDALPACSAVVPVATQLSSTHFFTLLSYSVLFSEKSLAASEFAGEFGFGSQSRLWIDAKRAATS